MGVSVVTISIKEFESLIEAEKKLKTIDAIIYCHNERETKIKEEANIKPMSTALANEVVHKIEFEAVCTLGEIKRTLEK